MATYDVVAIPATAHYASFNELTVGRSSQHIVARLLRYWDSRNLKKEGEFMGITLLLLDEKDTLIHAFIPASRADSYRDLLRHGLVYKVESFDVGRCTQMYRITEHPFVIRFIPTTSITPLDNGPSIEREKFMLRKFEHLKALANTNLELPGNLLPSTMNFLALIAFN